MSFGWSESDIKRMVESNPDLQVEGVKKEREAKPRTHKQQPEAGASESPSSASDGESRMISLWEAAFSTYGEHLPKPVTEYHFQRPWRNHRFDRAWPRWKIAVELDGIIHQAGGGRHNTDEDRFKLNCAAALGWRVFRFSSKQLDTEPKVCIELLKRAFDGLAFEPGLSDDS